MKCIIQYVYYRIAKSYKDVFGIEEAPGYFLIQSCYSWGMFVLLSALAFYTLAIETTVLCCLGIKMNIWYIVITILPFALFHFFSERIIGDGKERYKIKERECKNERLSWLKGFLVFVFVVLSVFSFIVALYYCR